MSAAPKTDVDVNDAGGGTPMLKITVGDLSFSARLEVEVAPNTVAAIRRLLPIHSKLVHATWCGEAGAIDMTHQDFDLGDTEHESFENHTHHPGRGELIIYPGGFSDIEIIFPYGQAVFARRIGNLAGNHFATVEGARDELRELGRRLIWDGAQDISIDEA